MAWQDVINEILHRNNNQQQNKPSDFLDSLLQGARNVVETAAPLTRPLIEGVENAPKIAGDVVNAARNAKVPNAVVDNPIFRGASSFNQNVVTPALEAATHGVATMPSDVASSLLQGGDLLLGGGQENALKQNKQQTDQAINDFLTNDVGVKNPDTKNNLAAKLGSFVSPLISNVAGLVTGGDATEVLGGLSKAGYGTDALNKLGDIAKLNPELAQNLIHTAVNPEVASLGAKLGIAVTKAVAGGTGASLATGGLEGQDPEQIARQALVNSGLGAAGEAATTVGTKLAAPVLSKLSDLHDSLKAANAPQDVLDHVKSVMDNEGGFIRLPGQGAKPGDVIHDVPGAPSTPEQIVNGETPAARSANAAPQVLDLRPKGDDAPLIQRPANLPPVTNAPVGQEAPLIPNINEPTPPLAQARVEPPATPQGGPSGEPPILQRPNVRDIGVPNSGEAQIPSVAPDGTPAPQPVGGAEVSAAGGAQIPEVAPDGTPAPPVPGKSGGAVPADPNNPVAGAADRLRARMQTADEISAARAKTAPPPNLLQRLHASIFDSNAPLNDLAKQVKATTGETLDAADNPHDRAQLLNGMKDAVKERTASLVSDLTSYKGTTGVTGKTLLDDMKTLGVARQVSDRSGNYPADVVAEAKNAVQDLQNRLSPEDFARIDKSVKNLNDFHDRQLQRLVEAKVISPEAYKGIKEANPNYFSKFNIIDHINENKALFGSSNSKNVRNNVIKAVKGLKDSNRFQILDPVESTIKSAFATEKAVQNNGIFHSVRNLADKIPDTVKVIRSKDDVLKQISLAGENQELRPVRDQIAKTIQRAGAIVRKLQTASANLEKRAYQSTLKNGGKSMAQDFLPSGLGGTDATSTVGDKVMGRTPGEQALLDAVKPTNLKLGPKDTKSFLNNLVEGPISEVTKLRKMIGNRDDKVSALLDHVENLRGQYDEVATKIKQNMSDAKDLGPADVPEGHELIHGMNDGIQETLSVPKAIADAYTGKNDVQRGQIEKIVAAVGRPLKTSVTSLSLPFQLVSNPVRDANTAAFVSKYIPKKDTATVLPYVGRWLKGFWDGATNSPLAREVALNGGGSAGVYGEGRSAEEITKDISRTVNGNEVNNAKDFVATAARMLGKYPGKLVGGVQRVGRALEYAPRLAEARAAKESGATPEATALAARNATADLQQGGTLGRVLNNYVTFLQARLSGNYNVAKSIKQDPVRAGVTIAANIATPVLMGYAWNYLKYPNVLKQMSQNDRDNNFILILGDHKDKAGNFTQVLKIPKNEPEQIFGNSIEAGMRAIAKEDPPSLEKLLGDALGQASTVQFMKNGKPDLSRAVSSTLLSAPALRAPAEVASNHNFYNDSDIVPQSLQGLPNNEQVRKDANGKVTTPAIDQFIAAVTGQSPLKVQDVRQTLTGNLGTQDPVSAVGSSFTGSNASQPTTEFYTISDKVTKLRGAASNQIDAQIKAGDYSGAAQTAADYNSQLAENFRPFAKQYGKYITPQMEKAFSALPLTVNTRTIKQRQRALQTTP